MKTVMLGMLLALGASNGNTLMAQAQAAQAANDTTAPSYDMKAQALIDLQGVNKKCVDLAKAIPNDKLTWRPSADSRSFAEVFLHVAGERYQILALGGATPPADFMERHLKSPQPTKLRLLRN